MDNSSSSENTAPLSPPSCRRTLRLGRPFLYHSTLKLAINSLLQRTPPPLGTLPLEFSSHPLGFWTIPSLSKALREIKTLCTIMNGSPYTIDQPHNVSQQSLTFISGEACDPSRSSSRVTFVNNIDKLSPERASRACMACRKRKAKCEGANDGRNPPCDHCKSRGLDCVFMKHQRGRKPGSRVKSGATYGKKLFPVSRALRQLDASCSSKPPMLGGHSREAGGDARPEENVARLNGDLQVTPTEGERPAEVGSAHSDADVYGTDTVETDANRCRKRKGFFDTVLI